MQRLKKVLLIVGIGLSAIAPFLVDAQYQVHPPISSMTAAWLQPGKGWISSAGTIPGMPQTIYYITSTNGPTGSVSWAFGFDDNSNYNMAVSTNGSTWGPAISVPNLGGHVGYGFLPAYPDTGSSTNGWLQGTAGISYFDGTSFHTATTFGGNPIALQAYASQGIGWALVNQGNGAIGVSTFNTTSSLNSWSPVQTLPLSLMRSYIVDHSFPVTASGGMLYALGSNNNKISLMVVDRNNHIHTYPIPYTGSQTPYTGLTFAYGNNVEVLLLTQGNSATVQGFSYLSLNGGVNFTNTSNQLPQFFSALSTLLATSANGVAVIPPSLLGTANQFRYAHHGFQLNSNLNASSASQIEGVFIDLKQKAPRWVVYPYPSSGTVATIWGIMSADGTQQCLSLTNNAFDCFNFTTAQWTPTAAIPAGEDPANFNGIVFLGNNQIAAVDINTYPQTPNALFYDGNSWTVKPITNMGGGRNNLSTSTVDGTFGSSVSPSAVWAFGFTAPSN